MLSGKVALAKAILEELVGHRCRGEPARASSKNEQASSGIEPELGVQAGGNAINGERKRETRHIGKGDQKSGKDNRKQVVLGAEAEEDFVDVGLDKVSEMTPSDTKQFYATNVGIPIG